jgi:hypothetical protein
MEGIEKPHMDQYKEIINDWNQGMEVEKHAFLILAVVGGEWSASCPGHLVSRERAPGTFWIGGWVGPSVGMYTLVAKEKNPCPC